MTVVWSPGFDRIADAYQDLWSATNAGRLQREAVWRHAMDLFPAGTSLLDLGCGPGDDAVMFSERGVRVTGIDASPEMVRAARDRGVDARHCAVENIGGLPGTFDGAWSNFGALNCVEDLAELRDPLSRSIRRGGWFVVCLMSRVCLWETLWYWLHGKFSKAVRRWNGKASSSVAPRVFYPTVRSVCCAFAPQFTLVATHGIGVAVPPSFVTGISAAAMDRLAALDRQIESLPLLRSLGDHRLLIFRKGVD